MVIETDAAAGEWISITDAAARLSAAGDRIDRSTLSRYLKQHSEALPTREEGKSHLVEYGALVAHRGENIRLRNIPPVAGLAAGPGSPKGRPVSRFAGSQSDGQARKAQADAEMREMDLAQRRGELTPTAEVDKAGRDAIALMQSAFERAIDSEAASLSVKYGWDERVARIALKAFVRVGLDDFNREIRERLDQRERERATGGTAPFDQASLQ
ncbi:MAG: hypothetical protein E5X61_02605 [Mesorhizobium sp.]|nr:MAG: hypothetical protein E5X60_00155 [Mesorhizobium sp.]TIQ58405.1 MAG: hypothetical protein E5X61_02605 [Mesorhizobium sp.]TJW57519.1 MAG: hypothetical protein E5X59_00730 [Mesorhizobium sp.]